MRILLFGYSAIGKTTLKIAIDNSNVLDVDFFEITPSEIKNWRTQNVLRALDLDMIWWLQTSPNDDVQETKQILLSICKNIQRFPIKQHPKTFK